MADQYDENDSTENELLQSGDEADDTGDDSEQPSALPLRNQKKRNLVPLNSPDSVEVDGDALANFDFSTLIKKPEAAPAPKAEKKGAIAQGLEDMGKTAVKVGKAVKNFVAPDKDYIPGSVMNDVPQGDPLAKPSKAPLAPAARKILENQYDAATPEKRAQLAAQPGAAGDVWREREQVYAKRTQQSATLDKLDPSAESRAGTYVDKGMDRKIAQEQGRLDARNGVNGQSIGEATANPELDYELQEKFSKDPVLSNPLVRAGVKSYEGYKQGVIGVNQFIADAIGADEASAHYTQMRNKSDLAVKSIGDPKNYGQKIFENALASIGQQIPAMIGGVATGSQALVLGAMAVQSFGQNYAEGRAAGQDMAVATDRAALMAAFEVIGEKFGMGDAVGGLRALVLKGNVDEAFKLLVSAGVKEVPGEVVTTLGQFAVDKRGMGYGLRAEADMKDLVEQVKETIVQTIAQGGIMAGVPKAAKLVSKRGNPFVQADKAVAGADIASEIEQAVNEIPAGDDYTQQEAVRRMNPNGTLDGQTMQVGPENPVPETTPEPQQDIQAQIGAMLDPENPKDSVFIAKGTEADLPALPGNVRRIERPEGTYLTTNEEKAAQVLQAPEMTDEQVAGFLGIPVAKGEVLQNTDKPGVVQARDAEGNIVQEAVTDETGRNEQAVAGMTPPGGTVTTRTPEQAQAERAARVQSIVPGREDSDITEELRNVKTVDEDGNEIAVAPPPVAEAPQGPTGTAPTAPTDKPVQAQPPADNPPVETQKPKAPGISRQTPKLVSQQPPARPPEQKKPGKVKLPKTKVETPPAEKPAKAPKIGPLTKQAFAGKVGARIDDAGRLQGQESDSLGKAATKGSVEHTLGELKKSQNPTIRFIAEAAEQGSSRRGQPLVIKTSEKAVDDEVRTGFNDIIKNSKMALEELEQARAADKILTKHKGLGVPPQLMKGALGKRMKANGVTTAAHARQLIDEIEKVYGKNEKIIRSNVKMGPANPKHIAGMHNPNTNLLVLRRAAARREHTVAHELTHAMTTEAILNPTDAQIPIVAALDKLYAHVMKDPSVALEYGMTNSKEFIAEGFTNPEFQYKLQQIEYEGETAWGKFTKLIARLLGIPHNNAFMELMAIGESLIESNRSRTGNAQADQQVKPAPADKAATMATADTSTTEFKNWFGDSKVVDAEGKPLVVYHGSKADIRTFTNDKGRNLNMFKDAQGFYFTSYAEDAGSFIKGKEVDGKVVYPVYLQIKNPVMVKEAPAYITPAQRAEWEKAGHDGVIFKGQWGDEYVAFRPNQIKSALGSRFTSADEIDLMRDIPDLSAPSRVEARQGNRFALPEETRKDYVQAAIQDRFNRIKRIQEAVAKQGGRVDSDSDIYGADERQAGASASKVEHFTKYKVKPLLRDMGRAGVDPDEVGLYLYAIHAKERNDQIAKINPHMPDGGSGMTNSEAAAILKSFRSDPNYAKIKAFATRLLDITKDTRKVMLEGHLVSQDTLDAWDAAYTNYVPLKGFERYDEFAGKQAGSGRGYDIRGSESRRALGRESRAGNIIENIVMDHERAITRAEKNKVARALLRFVLKNKDEKLWEVNKVVYKAQLRKDPSPGQVLYRLETVKDKDRTITVKENGEEFFVLIKDERMFSQLQGEKGMFNQEGAQGKLLKMWGGFNRFLTSMWTAYNPIFVGINAARDTATAFVHGATAMGPGFATKVLAMAPRAAIPIMKAERTQTARLNIGPNGPQTWAEWYQQYQEDGGKAGFYMFSELEDKERELRAIYNRAMNRSRGTSKKKAWAITRDYLHGMNELILDLNGGIENMNRLAAYRVAIESYNMSREEAASLAKNLTVNFNRRGNLTQAIGSFYLFFNPAVQGSVRIAKAFKDNPAMMSGMVSSMIAIGYFVAMASDGDEDENGMPYWDKIADYDKQKNIIVTKKNGDQWKYPLPYGYGFFVHAGYLLREIQRGRPITAAAYEMMNSFMKHFIPIGFNFENPATVMVPTVAIPVLEAAMEKKGTGQPLMPSEKNPDGTTRSDYERFWSGTEGTLAQKVTTWLGENTDFGGDAPLIDVSPETVNNTIKGYFGGAGTFLYDVANTISLVTVGDGLDAAVEKNAIPGLKAVYKSDNGKSDQAYFMQNSERAMKALEKFKDLQNSDEPEAVKRVEKLTDMAYLGASVQEIRKASSKMRKSERAIKASDMPEAEKKSALKEIDDARRQMYSQWNAEFLRKQYGLPEKK